MASDDAQPYRISCPQPILQQLRDWGERAITRGLRDAFVDTLVGVTERLSREPHSWGECRQHTPSGLPVYEAAFSLLHVTYSVHEVNRLVFIVRFQLMTNSPLI